MAKNIEYVGTRRNYLFGRDEQLEFRNLGGGEIATEQLTGQRITPACQCRENRSITQGPHGPNGVAGPEFVVCPVASKEQITTLHLFF